MKISNEVGNDIVTGDLKYMKMKLSIITINRNNAEGLRRTIRSVISQTCRDFEYIVIDGASDDGSTDIIREYQADITYWKSEPDKGIYNAMNKGVAQAHGDYCLFINAGDELADKNVLKRVLPRLKGTDFYAGDTWVDYGRKRSLLKSPWQLTVDYVVHRSVSHPATFTRMQLLKDRPYNEAHRIVSDWEFLFIEWLYCGRTYERIPFPVSVFYFDGISSTMPEVVVAERQAVMDNYLPKVVQGLFKYRSKLERKLMWSLHKHPVERDWTVLRNGVKYFFKDLFSTGHNQ